MKNLDRRAVTKKKPTPIGTVLTEYIVGSLEKPGELKKYKSQPLMTSAKITGRLFFGRREMSPRVPACTPAIAAYTPISMFPNSHGLLNLFGEGSLKA